MKICRKKSSKLVLGPVIGKIVDVTIGVSSSAIFRNDPFLAYDVIGG